MKMTVDSDKLKRLKRVILGRSWHSRPRPVSRKGRSFRKIALQTAQGAPSELKNFVVTPYGRRRLSWRKGRVVAGVVAVLAVAGLVYWISA
jgi:hypothetical protein